MSAVLSLHLHSRDLPLLHAIQAFLGGIGSINISNSRQSARFDVKKLKDIINIIIPHLKKYPLQGCKLIDFQLWSQCVEILANKEHLTESGLNKIISIKSAINLGVPDTLKAAFLI